MALPGETLGRDVTTFICTECGNQMARSVCQSAAGYYIGFWCDNCGPFSRETGYYASREDAETALASGSASWR